MPHPPALAHLVTVTPLPLSSAPQAINQLRSRARKGHPEDHASVRDSILDAALQLCQSEGGIDALSMRALAAAVGLSPMALYRYFANKDALLKAMWEVVVSEALAHTHSFAQRGQTARDRLELSIDGFLDYWERHPNHFRLVYMTESLLNSKAQDDYTSTPAYRAAMRLAPALLEDFTAEVGGDPSQITVARDLRFAMMVGYLHSRIINRRFPWGDAAALRSQVIKTIMLGMEDCIRVPPPSA